MIILYADGACEPVNPGGIPAWGYVIYHNGRWINEDYGTYGERGTNNIGEYAAVLQALGYLVDNGLTFEPVKVRSDSQLIINQLAGRWALRSEHLRPLYSQVKALEAQFPRVVYEWVPREQNEYADNLSRLAYRVI